MIYRVPAFRCQGFRVFQGLAELGGCGVLRFWVLGFGRRRTKASGLEIAARILGVRVWRVWG